MAQVQQCPQCGADLPADAPSGLCARCLLRQVMGDQRASPASTVLGPTLPPRPANPGGLERGSPVRYFGDYEILEEIARGGMGVVYKARQVSLDRVVALKMILAGQLASESAVERFYTEAKAAANLQHQNIVAIHEVGLHDGQHYFSMDYVEGQSLEALVQHGPLPAAKAAGYVKTIAEAIQFAHRQGTLHRDLKPSNILIDAFDQPRVTDFGLAKRIESSAQLTATGSLMGTPSYMSPEQAGANGEKVGPASDVYSLGAVLYELVTGRPPFLGESLIATLNQVQSAEPVSPRLLNPNVPRDLETICLKCLQKEPRQRYRSSEELANELGRFLRGEPIHARPLGKTARFWRWCKRKPLVASMASLLASLLIAVILVTALGYFLSTTALERSERTLYAAHINLAEEARQAGDDGRLADLLERHVPQPGQPDLRGWEWYYLRRQSRILNTIEDKSSQVGGRLWRLLVPSWQPRANFVVSSLAWSPDGRWLAGATWSDIKIWEPESGNEVCTLTPPAQWLAWHPDGRRLAAIERASPEVAVWDVVDRRKVLKLAGREQGYTEPLVGLAWSRDGRRLAFATSEKHVEIWDLASATKVLTLAGHRKDPKLLADTSMLIAWSPDDKQLLTSGERETKIWDAATGREIRTVPGKAISCSTDFKCVADYYHVFDLASGEYRLGLPATVTWQEQAWSVHGELLATGVINTRTAIMDAEAKKTVLTLVGRSNRHLAWRPDGKRLATGFDQVTIWDTSPRKEPLTLLGPRGEIHSLAWSPDGRCLAAGSGEFIRPTGSKQSVVIWDSENGKSTKTLEWSLSPQSPVAAIMVNMAWNPDGSQMAAIDGNGTVRIWKTVDWQPAAVLQQLPPFAGASDAEGRLAWSPDGKWLAAACGWTALKIWENDTWREVFDYSDKENYGVTLVGWSSSGELRFDTFNDGKAWNPVGGRLRVVGAPARGQLYPSPDERWVALSKSEEIQVWDPWTRWRWPSLPRALRGHSDIVLNVVWSPDSRRLVSGSQDGTAKIWDVASGQELLTFGGAERLSYRALGFSPDGHRLAMGRGNTVRILDARPRSAETRP